MNNMEEIIIKDKILTWLETKDINEELSLKYVNLVSEHICSCVLNLPKVNVIFEQLDENMSIYDIMNNVVRLNPKYIMNKPQLVYNLLHELEHYYQLAYISSVNTNKAVRWKKEFQNYITDKDKDNNPFQEIEIDAEAFAQIILSKEYNLILKNRDPLLQEVIERYIKLNKINSDD